MKRIDYAILQLVHLQLRLSYRIFILVILGILCHRGLLLGLGCILLISSLFRKGTFLMMMSANQPTLSVLLDAI